MGNDPLLPNKAPHPGFLTKASGCITTEREAIANHRQEEEIGIRFPALDGEDGGREKDHSIGPQIALPPTGMTLSAFGHTESHNAGDSRRQSCETMHNERKEEGEWKAIDHTGIPFRRQERSSARSLEEPWTQPSTHPSSIDREGEPTTCGTPRLPAPSIHETV